MSSCRPLLLWVLYLLSVEPSNAAELESPATEVIVLSPSHSLRRITSTAGKSHASPTTWRSSVENLVAPLLEFYPRRIPEFTVQLTSFNGQSRNLNLLRVQNPFPIADAGWQASPLPARVGDPDSALIIHDLTVTATPRTRSNGQRWVQVQTQASWSAANTSNVPRIVAARLSDPGGNKLPLNPGQTPPHERTHSFFGSGSLFFDEPVWQLELLTPDHSASAATPDILPAGPIGIQNQGLIDADSKAQAVPLFREARSTKSSAAVTRIAIRSTHTPTPPSIVLHFVVETIPPDHFLQLTSITDDLDQSWSLATPIQAIDAPRLHQVALVPPTPQTKPPKHFRMIFTVHPTRAHILRISPRFLGPDLQPNDLVFPFRPRP